MTEITLAEAIKDLRKAAVFTQAELGDRLAVSTMTVQRWESGAFKPSPSNLVRLYRYAADCNRPDLQSVFVRGGALMTGPISVLRQALPDIDEFLVDASQKLMQVLGNASIDSETRGALVGQALALLTDGRRLIAELSKFSENEQDLDA